MKTTNSNSRKFFLEIRQDIYFNNVKEVLIEFLKKHYGKQFLLTELKEFQEEVEHEKSN